MAARSKKTRRTRKGQSRMSTSRTSPRRKTARRAKEEEPFRTPALPVEKPRELPPEEPPRTTPVPQMLQTGCAWTAVARE